VLSWWDLIGNFCSVVLTFDLIDCQVIKKKTKKTSFVPIHTLVSQNYLLHFWKARKKLEPIYRKNNIFSPYKKKIFSWTSVIAAVIHYSLFKNSQYCASCSLNFSIEKHFGKKSRQRKYTVSHMCNTGVCSEIH
jgi:hypothetical protein